MRVAYLVGIAAGCAPSYGPTLRTVVPSGLPTVERDSVLAWVGRTTPTSYRGHPFKWAFKSPDEGVGGKGNARIAPPDSLRLDMAGPLGSKRTAGMVLGDSAVWVTRQDVLDKIIPSYPLLWAMLGVARQPSAEAVLSGGVAGEGTAWEYAAGADTIEYVHTAGKAPMLQALVRQAGRVVGRVETHFDLDGRLVSSRLYLPEGPSRLELTFTGDTTPARFKPEIWIQPER
jgi:hypothetical protein